MASKKGKQFTDADADLLGELGIESQADETPTYTAKQERIIAGFEDIQRFHGEHGRVPQHGEGNDIFERLYAVRLDRIRADGEMLDLLRPLDGDGLLDEAATVVMPESDDELLDALGVEAEPADDITTIKHVRPDATRKSPDEVAQRSVCDDFEAFRPQFEQVQREIKDGRRRTVPFKGRDNQKIERGDWYILDGQKAHVAAASEPFKQEYGERDRRLRVIFDNGTESDLLMRSLRRALNKDERSRRILPPDAEVGPLFSGEADNDDAACGTIYVARSLSDHPFVAEHRAVLHKIGVTGGDAKKRVAGAKKDPTFLLAEAELVAEYKLANLHRHKLEALLHQLLAPARLDVELRDRFDQPVEPKEWFLVPLPVIEEVVERISDGTVHRFRYEPTKAALVEEAAGG